MTDFVVFNNVYLNLSEQPILSNINFAVKKGSFTCLIGPSGSGKTSILRLASGLITPNNGEILINGIVQKGPNKEVAIVFQDYSRALLPWRNAYGNVSLALESLGIPKKLRKDRILELLQLVGLENHYLKYPFELSGGMQQRLQIARCLAQEPKFLLMDEPFGALDAITRHTLQDEVMRLQSKLEMTILFITHDIDEALYLGDQVIVLSKYPATVDRIMPINLAKPRNQIITREDPKYLVLRRNLFQLL
jgi:NitT/TauT family transport system ATP-binding protein